MSENLGTHVEGQGLPSIMGGMALADNECLVAIDEGGTGWIIAKSDAYRDTDVLPEVSAEDNGFNSGWDKGLSVGVYLVSLSPWANQTYEGEWDAGVDVLTVKPLWSVVESNVATDLLRSLKEISDMFMGRPDMVKALEPLRGFAENAVFDRAGAAIAKAEGRA